MPKVESVKSNYNVYSHPPLNNTPYSFHIINVFFLKKCPSYPAVICKIRKFACEFKHHTNVTTCDIPPFFHQPPQPPHNDAADDSHHTAPNTHNEVQWTWPPTNANSCPWTQTTTHEPKWPLMDGNDHVEARCHIADGDVATKWWMTAFVVVRRACLVSHGRLVPTSLTDNQTMNDDIGHHSLTCHNDGTGDNNTDGWHRDHGTTTWQERRTMMHQHATTKPCDNAQQWQCNNTIRQWCRMMTRCQCRTTTDHPHGGLYSPWVPVDSAGFPVESQNSMEFHGIFMETIWLESQPFGFQFPSAEIPWETALLSLSKIVPWSRIECSHPWHTTWIYIWAFFQLHHMPVQSVYTNLTNSCHGLATPKVNIGKCRCSIWAWSTTNNPHLLPITTIQHHPWNPLPPVADSRPSQWPLTSHNPHTTTSVQTNKNTAMPHHQARTWWRRCATLSLHAGQSHNPMPPPPSFHMRSRGHVADGDVAAIQWQMTSNHHEQTTTMHHSSHPTTPRTTMRTHPTTNGAPPHHTNSDQGYPTTMNATKTNAHQWKRPPTSETNPHQQKRTPTNENDPAPTKMIPHQQKRMPPMKMNAH